MEHFNIDPGTCLIDLVHEYEALTKIGTAPFYEETDFLRLLDYYETNRKWFHSLQLVDEALAQHCSSPVLYIRKAQILLNKNMIAEALVTLDEAEIYSPNELGVRLFRAELLSLIGESNQALRLLKEMKAWATKEEKAEIYFSESQIYENLCQYKSMFSSLRRALLTNPKHVEAAEKMLWAVEYTQQFYESIQFHTRLTDADPFNAWGWFNLGYAFKSVGKWEEAVEAYEFAIVVDERFELAYRELSDVFVERSKYVEAIHLNESSMHFFTPNPDVFNQIGYCYEQQGQIPAALAYYDQALELNDQCEETLFRLGRCCARLRQWDKASAFLQAAIKKDKRREDFYGALGEVYFQQENYKGALSCFRKAADSAPDETKYWLLYVNTLIHQHHYRLALSAIDEAEEYALNIELKYCRIACLLLEGKEGQGLYLLEEALDDDFEKHTALYNGRPELVYHEKMKKVIEVKQEKRKL